MPNLKNWKLDKIWNISGIFAECTNLISIPDISNWPTTNTKIFGKFIKITTFNSMEDKNQYEEGYFYFRYMFFKCNSLQILPDISKWNTEYINDMSYLFYECSSLFELPDISKWNTNNVVNMKCIFSNCKSLKLLPNISVWNTNNVKDISFMFENCISLLFFPNISKWKTDNLVYMEQIFINCNTFFIPDISKWNIKKIQKINETFFVSSSGDSKSEIDISDLQISNSYQNSNYSSYTEKGRDKSSNQFDIINNLDFNSLENNNNYYDNFYD